MVNHADGRPCMFVLYFHRSNYPTSRGEVCSRFRFWSLRRSFGLKGSIHGFDLFIGVVGGLNQ